MKRALGEVARLLWWWCYAKWTGRWMWGRSYAGQRWDGGHCTAIVAVRCRGPFHTKVFWCRDVDGVERLFA